ncbi:hypothetical protein ACWEQK_33370 [Streptomyces parvulus]
MSALTDVYAQQRLDDAQKTIRTLSLTLAVMIGVVGGLGTGIVAKVLGVSPIQASAAGGGAFIAVTTLALVVEARINTS